MILFATEDVDDDAGAGVGAEHGARRDGDGAAARSMKKSTVMFLMTNNQGHGAREHMHGRRPAAFAPWGTRIAVVGRPGVRHGAGHDGRFDSDSENPNYT